MRRSKYAYRFEACVSEDDMCAMCAVPYDDTSLDIIDDVLEDDAIEDALREFLEDRIRSRLAEKVFARRTAVDDAPDWL